MYRFLSALVCLVVTELIPSVSCLTWLFDRSLLDPDLFAGSFESDSSETAEDLLWVSSSSSSSPSAVVLAVP
jgi:hypothetical protein